MGFEPWLTGSAKANRRNRVAPPPAGAAVSLHPGDLVNPVDSRPAPAIPGGFPGPVPAPAGRPAPGIPGGFPGPVQAAAPPAQAPIDFATKAARRHAAGQIGLMKQIAHLVNDPRLTALLHAPGDVLQTHPPAFEHFQMLARQSGYATPLEYLQALMSQVR